MIYLYIGKLTDVDITIFTQTRYCKCFEILHMLHSIYCFIEYLSASELLLCDWLRASRQTVFTFDAKLEKVMKIKIFKQTDTF